MRSIAPNCSAPADSHRSPLPMTIQRILQFILVAIVLMLAFSLLVFLLRIGTVLLGLGLKLLLFLLIIAAVLRFFELLAQKRRY